MGCPCRTLGRAWKFSAVQLPYDSSSGEFAAQDLNVLSQLFDRFLVFLAGLSKALGAEGVSATMERASPLQARAEDKHSCQGVLWLFFCWFLGPLGAFARLLALQKAFLKAGRRCPPALFL